MSNPNNLIRPAVLNNINPQGSAPIIEGNRESEEERIARICAQQCELAIRRFLDPNSNIGGEDQVIDERYRGNLADLDKVPDVVRGLREFCGNPSEFSSWKKSVDRILSIYDSIKGTPKYFAILATIRNKIVGSADAALESYNTPLNWGCITKCLALHYADKRDLTTLEYQMSTLVQGDNKVQEFYQQVYSHLSLIMNKLSCMDVGREALDLLTQTYRDKALDTFIRGLKGNMSLHLGMREPKDLPQALHLCLKMENQFVRTQFTNSHNQTKNNKQIVRNHYRQEFFPQLAHMPQPSSNLRPYYAPNPVQQRTNFNQMRTQGYSNPGFAPPRPIGPNQMRTQNYLYPSYAPPRPTEPKPQPRPEPMDVDPSLRTRAINYMNRPVQNDRFFGKMPTNQSVQRNSPPKMQRNFHVEI